MSGLTFSITIDDAAVKRRLEQLGKQAKNMKPAMNEIAQYMLRVTDDRFDKGVDPEGEHWAPNAKSTIKRKGHAKPLINKPGMGHLRRMVVKTTSDSVTIGPSLQAQKYAAIQQFGGDTKHGARDMILHFRSFKRGDNAGKTLFSKSNKATHGMKTSRKAGTITIPARPYLGINDEDKQRINEKISLWIMMD